MWKFAFPIGHDFFYFGWFGRYFYPQAVLKIFVRQSIPLVRLECVHGGEGRLARVCGRKHCKHVNRESLDGAIHLRAGHPKGTHRPCTSERITNQGACLEINELHLKCSLIQRGEVFFCQEGEVCTWSDSERVTGKGYDFLWNCDGKSTCCIVLVYVWI